MSGDPIKMEQYYYYRGAHGNMKWLLKYTGKLCYRWSTIMQYWMPFPRKYFFSTARDRSTKLSKKRAQLWQAIL